MKCLCVVTVIWYRWINGLAICERAGDSLDLWGSLALYHRELGVKACME